MARIIVADDDFQVRYVLKQVLEQAGYDVVLAPDGKVATKLQEQDPADLAIVDIFMPEKEGLEAISEIRRDFPGTRIIAISGGGLEGPGNYLRMAALLGAHRILLKPLALDEILCAVRELLRLDIFRTKKIF